MAADAGQQMLHLFFLGAEVGFVFGAGFDFNGNAFHNFDAVTGELTSYQEELDRWY